MKTFSQVYARLRRKNRGQYALLALCCFFSVLLITKTPPAAVLIKKECNIESGSGVPNKTKVATISKASIQKIAEIKMKDLNAASLESAMSMIAGTARSMGVVVGD